MAADNRGHGPVDPKTQSLGELLLEWEDLQAEGHLLSVEAFCREHPGVDPQEFARRVSQLYALNSILDLAEKETLPGAAAPSPLPTLPGYTVEAELGRGGMGVVYSARDTTLNRRVALKLLPGHGPPGSPDTLQRARRFEREAQALARLRHPHIVPIYAAQLRDGQPFFVMELVEGTTLAEQVDQWARTDPRQVAALVEKLARAVDYAHRQQIIHRDLKLGNILIDADGAPRVGDFGLAKFADHLDDSAPGPTGTAASAVETVRDRQSAQTALTLPGAQPGTPLYMAPEQFDPITFGPVSPATDLWALGVILYELLTGRRPFAGADWHEVRLQVCRSLPVKPRKHRPQLDARLEAVVLRCLEKQPSQRFPSAAALADALARTQQSRWRWVAVAAAVAAGLGLAAIAWISQQHQPANASSVVGSTAPQQSAEEKYLQAVQPLLADLKGGKTVEVVPYGKPPVAYFPREGSNALKIKEQWSTGSFRVIHPYLALVELLPELPPQGFILRAEIRHEWLATSEGRVGLYFAGAHYPTPEGVAHVATVLSLVDPLDMDKASAAHDEERNQFQVHQACYAEGGHGMGFYLARMLHPRPIPKAQRKGWHQIVARVEPRRVEVHLDGYRLGAFDHAKGAEILRQEAPQTLFALPNTNLRLPITGGLGIMIHSGIITVRRLTVEPLP